jgi:hypothetical protein
LPPRITHHKASASRVGGHVIVDTGLSVTCPTGRSACSVVLTGTVSGAQSRLVAATATKAKAVVVGTLHTSVAAGKTLVLRLRLNAKGAALLKKHHRLKLVLTGTARTSGGPATRLSATITIANPPVKKHKHR